MQTTYMFGYGSYGVLKCTYLVRILHVKGARDYRTIVGLLQHIYLVRILHVKGARDYRTIVGLLQQDHCGVTAAYLSSQDTSCERSM